jgi:hypothetical protein
MSTEKIHVDFTVGDHPHKKDTIVMSITGTSFDISTKENQEYARGLVSTIASCLYAKANNIPFRKYFPCLKKRLPIFLNSGKS